MKFIVTEKAMRPALPDRQCFYCRQQIGAEHKSDCVLINKKVTVRMIVEYDVDVPALWEKSDIELHRNDGSWCANNAIDELKELTENDNCICRFTKFEFIKDSSRPFLDE